jgi:hypothetical protein
VRPPTEGQRDGQRGQGLMEFALVLPVIMLIVVSVAEVGLAFGNLHTIGYGTREGARVGSALALGESSRCGADKDPSGVDAAVVSSVQRILKSPGSGVDISKVQEIRIFKATSSGAEDSGQVNVWTYIGDQKGPEVDPGPGSAYIDFSAPAVVAWPACSRVNSGVTPDSIGVTVVYRYDFVTPLASVLDAIAGGDLSLTLSQTTVMSLNPSV